MEIVLVAGSKTAACTNADWAVFASLQAPCPASVATSWYGVASPAAVRGLSGTIKVQFGLGTAAGGGADLAAFCTCASRRSVPEAVAGLVCAAAKPPQKVPAPIKPPTMAAMLEIPD